MVAIGSFVDPFVKRDSSTYDILGARGFQVTMTHSLIHDLLVALVSPCRGLGQ